MFLKNFIIMILLIIGVCFFIIGISPIIIFGTIGGTHVVLLVISVIVLFAASILLESEYNKMVIGIYSTLLGAWFLLFSMALYSEITKNPEMAVKMQTHPALTSLIISILLISSGITLIILQKRMETLNIKKKLGNRIVG